MTTKHIIRLCVFALAILGLARAGLGQSMAEKTSEQDVFVLRGADGKIVGYFKFDRSPKTQQVDSLDYSGPPDVVADQKEDWTKWSRYGQLEAITLRMTTINKRLLEYISTLESVKELYCLGCIMEADALQALGKMKRLEKFYFYLDLDGKFPATDWKFLSGMENLRVLDVPGSRVNADFTKTFPHLRNLREIRISGVDEKTASEIYPRLSELKEVTEIHISVVRKRSARPD
jgi:hypothetical protein